MACRILKHSELIQLEPYLSAGLKQVRLNNINAVACNDFSVYMLCCASETDILIFQEFGGHKVLLYTADGSLKCKIVKVGFNCTAGKVLRWMLTCRTCRGTAIPI